MQDIAYIAATIGFFILMELLARGCERLIRTDSDEASENRR